MSTPCNERCVISMSVEGNFLGGDGHLAGSGITGPVRTPGGHAGSGLTLPITPSTGSGVAWRLLGNGCVLDVQKIEAYGVNGICEVQEGACDQETPCWLGDVKLYCKKADMIYGCTPKVHAGWPDPGVTYPVTTGTDPNDPSIGYYDIHIENYVICGFPDITLNVTIGDLLVLMIRIGCTSCDDGKDGNDCSDC